MLKRRWLTLILLSSALIMSLAPIQAGTPKGYIETLNTWIGEEADSLLHQWGQPVKVERIGDGRFEVFYQAESAYYHPEIAARSWQECMFNGHGQIIGCNDRYDPGRAAYYSYTQCYTVFEVEEGTIIKWHWNGDCKN